MKSLPRGGIPSVRKPADQGAGAAAGPAGGHFLVERKLRGLAWKLAMRVLPTGSAVEGDCLETCPMYF